HNVITAQVASATKSEPLGLTPSVESGAPGLYFVEEVRRYLIQKYGEEELYSGGLSVDTTLDLGLQTVAEKALRGGIMQVEARRGFRTKWKNVASQGPLERYRDPAWGSNPPDVGRRYPGLVTAVTSTSAQLRVGAYKTTLAPPAVASTGRKTLGAGLTGGPLCLLTPPES